jgi:hypothetical protein
MDIEKELTSLHWQGIPGFPYRKSPPSNLLEIKKIFKDDPFFVFFGSFDLSDITKIKHSKHTVDYLNLKGLNIVLYEPLSSKLKDEDYTCGFFSEFHSNIDLSNLRARELDCISDYIKNNSLTNVVVHTCDYNAENKYPYYNGLFKLVCNDLFVKQLRFFQEEDNKLKISKKFIVPNWRYSKHRHLITSYISKNESYYSWYYKCPFEVLTANSWFNLNTLKGTTVFDKIQQGTDYLNSSTPVCLDIVKNNYTEITHGNNSYWPPGDSAVDNPARLNRPGNPIDFFYKTSFCAIVNETRFAQPTANFSEKLLFSVKYKTPFILVAPPKTLKYFKTFGFKTFSSFWSEEYDNIENHELRLLEIFKLINNINEKSLPELESMYSDMKSVIEYNYQLLIKQAS